VFGSLPACLEDGQGVANRVTADRAGKEPTGIGNVGHQPQGPDTGGLAKGPGTLVEQAAQRIAAVEIEDGLRGAMGAEDPRRKAARPRALNAWITWRTV
jgi:hypothetical protein